MNYVEVINGVMLVEVHGNNGTSHKTVAKHHAEKQGFTVLDVKPSGERCRHGHMVWAVTVEEPEEDDQ